jgi:hypothetical protein
MCPALKLNLSCQSFKNVRDVETAVAQRLVKNNQAYMNIEQKSFLHDKMNFLIEAVAIWKSSGLIVQLSIKYPYWL